jgi:hypothetical protein
MTPVPRADERGRAGGWRAVVVGGTRELTSPLQPTPSGSTCRLSPASRRPSFALRRVPRAPDREMTAHRCRCCQGRCARPPAGQTWIGERGASPTQCLPSSSAAPLPPPPRQSPSAGRRSGSSIPVQPTREGTPLQQTAYENPARHSQRVSLLFQGRPTRRSLRR